MRRSVPKVPKPIAKSVKTAFLGPYSKADLHAILGGGFGYPPLLPKGAAMMGRRVSTLWLGLLLAVVSVGCSNSSNTGDTGGNGDGARMDGSVESGIDPSLLQSL